MPSLSFLNSFLYSDFYMGYFPTTSLAGSLMFKVKLDAISLERFFGAQFPNRITSLPHGFCPLITIYLSRSSLYFKFFVGGAHGGAPEYSPAAEGAQTISTDVWVEGLWRKHWDALCTQMRHRTAQQEGCGRETWISVSLFEGTCGPCQT